MGAATMFAFAARRLEADISPFSPAISFCADVVIRFGSELQQGFSPADG